MGIVSDFKDWISGGVEDDEDFDMDEEPVEEAEEKEASYYNRREARRASAVAEAESMEMANRSSKVVVNATTKLAVVLIQSKQFNDVAAIADHLKQKETIVLNLVQADKETTNRMLDFMSGVTYAIEGKIKRVAADTYLITPLDVEIVGDDLISELENNGMRF